MHVSQWGWVEVKDYTWTNKIQSKPAVSNIYLQDPAFCNLDVFSLYLDPAVSQQLESNADTDFILAARILCPQSQMCEWTQIQQHVEIMLRSFTAVVPVSLCD